MSESKKIVLEKSPEIADIPLKTPDAPKKKRGRPKGSGVKIRKYDRAKYSANPIAVTIDKYLVKVAEVVTKKDLSKVDCEIGEAIAYSLDYYGTAVFDHPIAVLVFASATFGIGVATAQRKETTKSDKQPFAEGTK